MLNYHWPLDDPQACGGGAAFADYEVVRLAVFSGAGCRGRVRINPEVREEVDDLGGFINVGIYPLVI